MRTLLMGIVVVSILFSGCAGSDKPGPSQIKAVEETTASAAPDFGSLDGTVVDSEVLPIKGVAIILFDGGGKGADLRATTNENGKFTFNHLTPGAYRVLADLSGYTAVTQNVNVNAGEVAEVQFTLERVVVKIVRPDVRMEQNGTIQGPIFSFQGPNGDESQYFPITVEEWPLAIYANLSWPCGTACVGPPETNYMNVEIIDADGIAKRCTQEQDKGNNQFFLTCKQDSFANAGEYKIRVFCWEGHDVNWHLEVTIDY